VDISANAGQPERNSGGVNMRYIVKLLVDMEASSEEEAIQEAKLICAETDGFEIEVEEIKVGASRPAPRGGAMSLTKWTPGPWIPERFNEGRQDESITITAYTSDDRNAVEPVEIADVSDMAMSEAEANARLISAAPKLYSALQAIIEPDNKRTIRFDSKREYYVAEIEGGELARAQTALAEARGESSTI
jgi:hypothetical protein